MAKNNGDTVTFNSYQSLLYGFVINDPRISLSNTEALSRKEGCCYSE